MSRSIEAIRNYDYKIFGRYVIDELQFEVPLEKALKNAHDYCVPWARKAPIKMIVHTECEPIEYSFGVYVDEGGIPIDPEHDETNDGGCNWHEICRVKRV